MTRQARIKNEFGLFHIHQIGYAMYAKCPGRLFKYRCKIQLLSNESEMVDHVEHLHRNAKDSSPRNSFYLYAPLSPLKLDWVTPPHVAQGFDLQASLSFLITKKFCSSQNFFVQS